MVDLGPAAQDRIERTHGQTTPYAEELERLHSEQLRIQAELNRKITELEVARAQLREYARDMAETYSRLRRTYLETLDSLAMTVEQRDNMTGGHSHRVAHYAGLLGDELDLSQETRRALHYGSALHDIGKIAIPDAVLNKPGKLTDGEWEVMRRHPEIGALMIERVEFLQPAVPLILTHHERYDGRGYPRGLRGEQIPVASRIFQVADALDAILSDRPYRRGQPLESALQEIAQHAGSQFDPRVVAVLERIAPRLEVLPADYGIRSLGADDPSDG